MGIRTNKEIRLENLRILIREAGTKAELSRRTGVNQAYLTQVETNDPNSEARQYLLGDDAARRLELGMGRDPGWMDQDHSEELIGNTHVPPLERIRIISWSHAGTMDAEMYSMTSTEDAPVVYADRSIAPGAFALRVRGDSMVNSSEGASFPHDCIIVVEPTEERIPGDHVIVRLPGVEEAIFKTIEFDGHQYFLKPLNHRYPIIPMPADARVIGRVVSVTTRVFRR